MLESGRHVFRVHCLTSKSLKMLPKDRTPQASRNEEALSVEVKTFPSKCEEGMSGALYQDD